MARQDFRDCRWYRSDSAAMRPVSTLLRRADGPIHGCRRFLHGHQRRPDVQAQRGLLVSRSPPTIRRKPDRYWNAIVGNGGQESACGWCKDEWGVAWQITPRVLTAALAAGGAEAKRAFDAMMDMKKIDVAVIKAARRG